MEQNNQVDLSQASDIQLKAFVYDELAKVEMAQANLRIINQEIANRAKSAADSSSNGVVNSGLPVIK